MMLNGKKTYIVAVLAAAIACWSAWSGQEVPDWVWVLAGALGLGTLRAGVAGLKVPPAAPLLLAGALLLGGCTSAVETHALQTAASKVEKLGEENVQMAVQLHEPDPVLAQRKARNHELNLLMQDLVERSRRKRGE